MIIVLYKIINTVQMTSIQVTNNVRQTALQHLKTLQSLESFSIRLITVSFLPFLIFTHTIWLILQMTSIIRKTGQESYLAQLTLLNFIKV